MPADHFRYDVLVQQALRGVVHDVLAETIKKGLVGDHHFFITFDTSAEGVHISERLRAQYPEEMTIVLQHQFWDLKVTAEAFEVGLSFGGIGERLIVPFAAIVKFADPAAQFALQFETDANAAEAAEAEETKLESQETKQAPAPQPGAASAKAKADDKAGAEVVRLDRFRKK